MFQKTSLRAVLAWVTFALFYTGSGLAVLAQAQDQTQDQDRSTITIPETDVYYDNIDLAGNDLEQLFKISFDECRRACSQNDACAELTYNQKSNACFLKSGGSEFQPFDGALSMMKVRWPNDKKAQLQTRETVLDFLGDEELRRAQELRRKLSVYMAKHNAHDRLLSLDSFDGSTPKSIANAMYYESSKAWIKLSQIALEQAYANLSGPLPEKDPVPYVVNALLFAQDQKLGRSPQDEKILGLVAKYMEEREKTKSLNQYHNPVALVSVFRTLAQLNPEWEARYQKVERKYSPYPEKFTVESNDSQPRVCFQWSQNLDPDFEYGDYIEIQPEMQVATNVSYDQLCITGFDYGQTAHIVFREGIPSEKGLKSVRVFEYDVTTGDQTPGLRFDTEQFVIPNGERLDVPLYSVNLDNANLELYRANPNILAALRTSNNLFKELYQDQRDTIRDTAGELIWKGKVGINNTSNQEVATGLPFADLIADAGPGAYLVIASADNPLGGDVEPVVQWFLISELGVTSFTGQDGLHVFLNGFSDAEPEKGVTVKLISRANKTLAEIDTNRDGYAHFKAPLLAGVAGNAPLMLQVEKGNDFNVLPLDNAGFDFSDRGVKGRPAASAVDVYVTSERGVYLPGDDVHFTILARDGQARAISDIPLTAKLFRPDGKLYLSERLDDGAAGGRSYTATIGQAQPSGKWELAVYADPDGQALGRHSFLVENFVPHRFEYTLTSDQTQVNDGDRFVAEINARYLYGAPGADLRVAGWFHRKSVTTLEAYPGYLFETSLHQDGDNTTIHLNADTQLYTDNDGRLELNLELPKKVNLFGPEMLTLRTELSDSSGRPVPQEIQAMVAPQHNFIGIKPDFDIAVGIDETAKFEVIAIGQDFARQAAPNTAWQLFRVQTDYQWYQRDGKWKYKEKTKYAKTDEGVLNLTTGESAEIAVNVDWGEYELRVQAEGSPVYAVHRFYSGYYGPSAQENAPDRLLTALDKDRYSIGDRLRLNIESAGEAVAIVSVFNDHLVEQHQVALSRGNNEVALNVADDWGSGTYIVTSAIRPLDSGASRLPQRAVGVNWVTMNTDEKRLEVALETPQPLRPRSTGTIIVTIDGARNEEVYLTLAAVDKGILNVTDFQPPQPLEYYFGQRRLGFEMRDLYGRFLAVFNGQTGVLRSGGDEEANTVSQAPIANKQEDYLVQFSGIVQVDGNGQAQIPLDIPAFNGTARMMAIAWSNERMGAAYSDQEIRDPVVVLASHPRYLALGDESRLHLDITPVDAPGSPVTVSFKANEFLSFGSETTLARDVVLTQGEKQTLEVPLTATGEGTGEIWITLTTDTGTQLEYKRLISVVDTRPRLSKSQLISVPANSTRTASLAELSQGFDQNAQITTAPEFLANLRPEHLAKEAANYPFGCSEQLSSTSLRAVLFKDFLPAKEDPVKVLDTAADTLIARQGVNGMVGLWQRGDGDSWLQAQVVHVMTDMRAAGVAIPDLDYQSAVRYLKGIPQQHSTEEDGSRGAYALYVLALIGEANIGDIRYYATRQVDGFTSALPMAQVAAALALYNNKEQAKPIFENALSTLRGTRETYNYRIYSSRDRDLYGVFYLGLKHGLMDVDDVLNELAEYSEFSLYPNTQDLYWGMRLAHALNEAGYDFDDKINDVGTQNTASDQIEINNPLGSDLVYRLQIQGRSGGAAESVQNGLRISRSYFDMQGNRVEPDTVAQNQQLVVVLHVSPTDDSYRRLVVSDPLPAGLEIDSPHLLQGSDNDPLEWLKRLDGQTVAPQNTEFGPTYFNAFVDWSSTDTFKLTYQVRAISPGTFKHYPAKVQDMYDPSYTGSTTGGRVIKVE